MTIITFETAYVKSYTLPVCTVLLLIAEQHFHVDHLLVTFQPSYMQWSHTDEQ